MMHHSIHKKWIAIGVVPIVLVLLGLGIYFRPRARLSVRTELVGADPVIAVLLQGSSLAQIQAEVQQSGKHADKIQSLGGSLLFYAVQEKRYDIAKWLLTEEGANPNGVHFSVVPLATAIRQNDLDMVRLLLDSGADPDFDMGYGITPRKIARSADNTDILSLLPPPEDQP